MDGVIFFGNGRCSVVTGRIGDSPDWTSFTFDNTAVRDVTITNCDSDFDTNMFLVDSDGNGIQMLSDNECDGNDCYDYDYCSFSARETFTMSELAVGTYTVLLTPQSAGGDWTIRVHCGGIAHHSARFTNIFLLKL